MTWIDEIEAAPLAIPDSDLERIQARVDILEYRAMAEQWGKSLGDELIDEGTVGHGRYLLATLAEDADHFSTGLMAKLTTKAEKVALWCFWAEEFLVDSPEFLSHAEIGGEYIDDVDGSFDRLLVAVPFLADPAKVRSMLSRIALKKPEIVQPILVTGVLGLDYDCDLQTIFPYFKEPRLVRGSRAVEHEQALELQRLHPARMGYADARSLFAFTPKLVLDAIGSRNTPTDTHSP